MVLSKHYRTEGNFTWEILEASQNHLNNWQAVADLRWQRPESEKKLDILSFLNQDLSTHTAVTAIDKFFDELAENYLAPSKTTLDTIHTLLGINLLKEDITQKQKLLLTERKAARESKNWELSDAIRQTLKEQGIEIRDATVGQIWTRTT